MRLDFRLLIFVLGIDNRRDDRRDKRRDAMRSLCQMHSVHMVL
jgi:hypothetical protein